jgi:hypothetical protein
LKESTEFIHDGEGQNEVIGTFDQRFLEYTRARFMGTLLRGSKMTGVPKALLVFAVCLLPILGSAQIASENELASISARGRMLYEYDQAAWHATDAVMSTNPPRELIGRYIARKTEAGWVVAFGRLNEAKDAFLISVMATQGSSLQDFTVKRLDPPQSDTAFYLLAARSIDTVLPVYHGAATRTYNAASIANADGRFYVYLEPGQTDADGDYFPLGADVRFLVSADGKAIVETRQMHKSIIPKAELPSGTKLQAGYHTHVLSEIPEDSDVYVVLSRKPSIPEYVASRTAIYVVNTDGSIHFVEKMKKRK